MKHKCRSKVKKSFKSLKKRILRDTEVLFEESMCDDNYFLLQSEKFLYCNT